MYQKILLAIFFLLLSGVFHPLYAAGPVMVEKDLFSVDRKPPSLHSEGATSNAGGRDMAINNIELDGVIIRNNSRKALLRIKGFRGARVEGAGSQDSPFVVIREGGTVNGYRVTKIKLRSVSLQKNGRTYTIDLFAANKVVSPQSPERRRPAGRNVQARGAGERGRPPGLPPGIPRLPPGFFPKSGFNPGKPPKVIPRWNH